MNMVRRMSFAAKGSPLQIRELSGISEDELSRLLARGAKDDAEVEATAREIIDAAKAQGFAAVRKYTLRFDGVELSPEKLRVSESEILEAYTKLGSEQLEAIRTAKSRIAVFQKALFERFGKDFEMRNEDGRVAIRMVPVERVGIYAPGGRAPLPSSVLMAAIPARIAGVGKVVLCTPPQKDGKADPGILVAAREAGVDEIFMIGGAQAIAAMAYGLKGILEPVDVIAGPGNRYVMAAKGIVSARNVCRIDLPAGPSEVLIIADESADPGFVAADMLAQAEHGPDSAAICLTNSKEFAEAVAEQLRLQLELLSRKGSIHEALASCGAILLTKNLDEAVDFANRYAPEHLELFTAQNSRLCGRVRDAGAIFIGTGEAFADYGMSGGNHILPTGRSARFASGLSVLTFLKFIYEEELTAKAQQGLAETTALLAEMETLDAHAASARLRKEGGGR